MEPITEPEIDLFADTLPSTDEVKKLSEFIHSSELNRLTFAEQVKENAGKTSPRGTLAVGIGLFILGKNAEAIAKLKKAKDCKEKFIYIAFAL